MGDQRVLILGAGGHGQVVAEILNLIYQVDGQYKVIGYLDDDHKKKKSMLQGYPVLGSIDQLKDIPHDFVIVAIGDNQVRARIFEKCLEQGESFINAVHPNTIISPRVELGLGVMICGGVVINTESRIMNNVILNTGCTVDHHNLIHDHVHIAPGCTLGGDVAVGAGSLIGIGATILPQLTIGEGCIVGAGAVVTQNVRDNSSVLGIPARERSNE